MNCEFYYLFTFIFLLREFRNIMLHWNIKIQFPGFPEFGKSNHGEAFADAGDSHDRLWLAWHTVLNIGITQTFVGSRGKPLSASMVQQVFKNQSNTLQTPCYVYLKKKNILLL